MRKWEEDCMYFYKRRQGIWTQMHSRALDRKWRSRMDRSRGIWESVGPLGPRHCSCGRSSTRGKFADTPDLRLDHLRAQRPCWEYRLHLKTEEPLADWQVQGNDRIRFVVLHRLHQKERGERRKHIKDLSTILWQQGPKFTWWLFGRREGLQRLKSRTYW